MGLLHIGLLLSCLVRLSSSYSCLDESGNSVDTWTALTSPTNGNYYYFDINNQAVGFQKSLYNVDQSTNGAIMKTVAQVYSASGEYAFGMYNDDPPGDYTPSSSTYAHSKGVIMTSATQGFWLVHSKPNWPNGSYALPFPDLIYAQSLECITVSAATINTIAGGLKINRPYIYAQNITPAIEAQLPQLASWLSHQYNNTALTSVTTIQTSGGRTFQQFAKSKSFGKSTWDDLVAPYYETPLNVETWILGSGGRMSSICGANNTFLEYNIYQVDDVKMPFGTNWSNTADHSKWANAVSRGSNANQQSYSSPNGMLATCVGDTNRMCSQENRGGGALCTEENYYLWLAFNSSIAAVESCFEYYPCTSTSYVSSCYWCPYQPTYTPTRMPSNPTVTPSLFPTEKPTHEPTAPSHSNSLLGDDDLPFTQYFEHAMRISIPLVVVYGLLAGLYLHFARRKFVGVVQLPVFDVVFMSVSSASAMVCNVLFALSMFEQQETPSLRTIGVVVLLMRIAVIVYSSFLIHSANFDDSFAALLSAKAMSATNIFSFGVGGGSTLYSLIVYSLMLGTPSCVKLLPFRASEACSAAGGYPSSTVMRNCLVVDVTLCLLLLGTSAAVDNIFTEYRTSALMITLLAAVFYLMYTLVTGVIILNSNRTFSDGSADPLKEVGDSAMRDSIHSVNSDLFLASPYKLSPQRTSVNILSERADRNSAFVATNPMLYPASNPGSGSTSRTSLTRRDIHE